MAREFRRVPFRGEMRTISEVSKATGLHDATIYARLKSGRPLEAPVVRGPRKVPGAMWDDSVRYEQDIECRVARLVCGGTCDQRQLGLLFGVTSSRIQQIESRALEKLRHLAGFSDDARELLELLDELRSEATRGHEAPGRKLEIRRSA